MDRTYTLTCPAPGMDEELRKMGALTDEQTRAWLQHFREQQVLAAASAGADALGEMGPPPAPRVRQGNRAQRRAAMTRAEKKRKPTVRRFRWEDV